MSHKHMHKYMHKYIAQLGMISHITFYHLYIGTCDIVHWSAASHHRIAYRTGFGVCVVLVLNVIRCSCHYFLVRILFHHDSCDYHWNSIAINYLLIYTLCFLYVSNSGSANAQLPGCLHPWTFSLNIGLNMFPLESFMSYLHSLLRYSTGLFQALQLIVLAVFMPWINHLSPVCWSTFWKSSLLW